MTNDTLDRARNADAMTFGAAIQLAWDNHRDLPPIDLTDDEMRYLGEAVIGAMQGGANDRTA